MPGVDDRSDHQWDEPAVGRRIATALGLAPLDAEGGLFRRTYGAGPVSAIYYLVVAPDFSALHRLRACDELFFFHAGAPLRMLLLDHAEHITGERVLGPDPLAGQHPQLLVPAGCWQGASSTAGWSLVSTVVTPGFQWHDFELGDREQLIAGFPDVAVRIAELTR